MFEIGISFGQTASHSPSFEQLPKPSASACSIIATTRARRSSWPCGSRARCEILALMNRCADAFLHAATQAPQPMQAAAVHRQVGDVLGDRDRVAVRRAAAVHRDVAAGRDDAVERAAIDDEILDDGERLGAPRLDRDRVAVLEAAHVELADGRAAVGPVGDAVDDEAAHAADAFAAIGVERDRVLAASCISPSLTTSSISRNDMSGDTSSAA